jgi:anti-anti-sigma factor
LDAAMLEINSECTDNVLIIAPIGRLDGITSRDFSEKIINLIDALSKHVVLNLTGLNYVSSEGLRVILTAAKKAKSGGGTLTLCSPQQSVHEVLTISGFAPMLGVHGSVEDAVIAVKN